MIAVYPGSFDPITAGHYDIIKRAAALYDTVIVAVAENMSKAPLFSVDERLQLLSSACRGIDNVVVDRLGGGLLVDFARRKGARVIIRGLRAISDYDYECQMALLNRRLCSEIETVFLMASSEHSFLSSSIVKGIGSLGGKIDGLVPEMLVSAIEAKFGATRLP
ncbi:MAG: pantetheine-phosphate adenylyltransferase [Capsulimonadaceae bacterium]